MNYTLNDISTTLDEMISHEFFIEDSLRDMLKTFKKEKDSIGYPFGALCVLHYKEYADEFDAEIYKVAAAIELLVLSFDIIDDLQDNDTDYVWVETPKFSLNSVLAMLVIAFKVLRQSHFVHKEQAMQIIEKHTLLSISGQQLDLLNVYKDERSYLKMIEQKSGSLTSMSCLVGEVLARGKKSLEVEDYAKAIGIIGQIKNDIQDLEEWNQKNDIVNKRYSLPIIFLLSMGSGFSKDLEKYYHGNESIELDESIIKKELQESGAIRYAIAVKNLYKKRALNTIEKIGMSLEGKESLQILMK
ncbi:polyprenyl synthetase family protein [Lysinibacillus antri]|nr:polyprenyl synthetase family protein [Lysinibacillus antri]